MVARPPMCTHGWSSFPRVITLFGQGRRVSRTPSQILVPHSGSSFLVPDLTYRFITPSPPSEKEASLTPRIIYTIIRLTLVRAIPVLKTRNSLQKYLQRWGSTEKAPRKSLPYTLGFHSTDAVLCLFYICLSTIACQYATYLFLLEFSVLVPTVVSRVTALTSTVLPGLMVAESFL